MHFKLFNFARQAKGFTLVEMVIAIAISALVVVGLFSSMMLAGRATETTSNRAAIDMRSTLDRIRDDAACATAISALTSTTITMTLPDRNADGIDENVSYDWTKATSGMITRTYNGVLENIAVKASSFSVTADVPETSSGVLTESAEQLLFSRTPTLPLAYAVKPNNWSGQTVQPTLPSNATKWRITRVVFPARSTGKTDGYLSVQIRALSGGSPQGSIDSVKIAEATLPTSFASTEVSFTNASNLSPGNGICVVWQWLGSTSDGVEVQYESLLSLLAAGQRVTSTNSGQSWTGATLQACSVKVYGTYSVPANTTIRTLRSLSIQTQADSTLAPIKTSVRFANLPRVTG